MAENSILLTNDTIEFLGFDSIKEKLTFCFYSGGIVIVPEWETENLPCQYESKIENDRKIRDFSLIQKLKDRGIDRKDSFIKIKNHYAEMEPHGEQR